MTCEVFKVIKFQRKTLEVIDQARAIIDEWQAQDIRLGLRTLFYQFVARGLLENNVRQYERLGDIIRDARDCGLIDWDAIEDGTRTEHRLPTWDSPSDIISGAADQYREDLWRHQLYQPLIGCEKAALFGTLEPVADELRVPLRALRGNASTTALYDIGKDFERETGHPPPDGPRSFGVGHDPRCARARVHVCAPGGRGATPWPHARPGAALSAAAEYGKRSGQALRRIRRTLRD